MTTIEDICRDTLIPTISNEDYQNHWKVSTEELEKSVGNYAERVKGQFEDEQPNLLNYFREELESQGLNVRWGEVYRIYDLVSQKIKRDETKKIPLVSIRTINREVHPLLSLRVVGTEDNFGRFLGFLKERNYRYFFDIEASFNSNSSDEGVALGHLKALMYAALDAQLKSEA